MLLSLALLLCQEPALRWSREVDDQFWQALHLLEVEERAEDAAATLASLIEQPSVQQYRGQTGYLLAQQYRALRAAGRHDEAQALLPSIRRDVAGTDFAALTEQAIDLADATFARQDGTDDQLIEILVNATYEPSFLRSLLRGYGDRAVPEILEILDNPDEYFDEKNRGKPVQELWEQAWALNSSVLLTSMASRVQLRGWDYLKRFRLNEPLYQEIGEAQQSFLIKLSIHPDARVVRYVTDALVSHAHTRPEILERIREIVFSKTESAPVVLNALFNRVAFYGHTELQEVLQAALTDSDVMLASSARSMAMEHFEVDSLRFLADERNDEEARLALLAAFRPDRTYGGSVEASNPSNRAFDQDFATLASELSIPRNRLGFHSSTRTFDHDAWGDWLAQCGETDDARLREYVFGCAVERHEFETAVAMLERGAAPERWPLYLVTKDLASEPRLEPFLFQALHDPVVAPRAWAILAGSSHRPLERISHEDFTIARKILGEGQVNSRYAHMHPAESSEGREIARRRLKGLATSIEFLPSERLMFLASFLALTSSIESAQESAEFAFEVLEVIPEWSRFGQADQVLSNLWNSLRESPSWAETLAPRYASIQMERVLAKTSANHPDPYLAWVPDVLETFPTQAQAILRPVLADSRSARRAFAHGAIAPWIFHDVELMRQALSRAVAASQEEDWALVPLFDSRFPSPDAESITLALDAGDLFLSMRLWGSAARHAGTAALPAECADAFLAASDRDRLNPRLASIVATYLARANEGSWVRSVRDAWAMDGLADRKALIDLIGARYEPDLIPILLDAQTSAVSGVAYAADQALERYARIRDARESWKTWERQGREGSPVDALIAKTMAEKPANIRIAAIKSLGALGATEALPFLVELLEDSDQEVVAAAQAALDRIHAASEGSDDE